MVFLIDEISTRDTWVKFEVDVTWEAGTIIRFMGFNADVPGGDIGFYLDDISFVSN